MNGRLGLALKWVAVAIVVLSAIAVFVMFFSSSAESCSAVKDDARKAVSAYGRGGSAADRKSAKKIIRKRVAVLKQKSMVQRDLAVKRMRAKIMAISSEKDAVNIIENPLSEEDRKIIAAANVAVSARDMDAAQTVAAEALKAADPRVRLAAVETISNFGEAGLPELADFLVDKDPEVAGLAADRFELCTQEIEDDREIAAVIKLGMLTVDDPDKLASFGGTMMLCADQQVVISALTDIIAQGTVNQIAAAKEVYANTTGNEWTTPEMAQTWLKENYDPIEYEDLQKSKSSEVVHEE